MASIDCTQTELGCLPNDPIAFAGKFYGIGLSIIGAVAIVSIVYGGYVLMTSRGNPEQLQKGKSYIVYSIVGLLLAIFGVALMQVVTIDVFQIPGFSR